MVALLTIDPTPWVGVVLWVLIGSGVAAWLSHRGHGADVALSAVLAWPFMVSALVERAAPERRAGAQARRIDAVVDGVLRALSETGEHGPDGAHDLESVRASLHEADARVAQVETILLEDSDADHLGVQAARQALIDARDRSVAEVDAVLAGLQQLRLQVGRLSLAGDPAEVRQRLAELRARVSALSEVARLDPRAVDAR